MGQTAASSLEWDAANNNKTVANTNEPANMKTLMPNSSNNLNSHSTLVNKNF